MSKQNTVKLLLDACTFSAFLILMQPGLSGIAVHEWLAITLAGTIVVHLLLNWNWVAQMTARALQGKLNGSTFNYWLNWALFLDGVLVVLSGLMISQVVVPSIGIQLPSNFGWRGIHQLSTNLVLVILGLHVAIHWTWIVNTTKRLFGIQPARTRSASKLSNGDAQA